MGLKANNCLVDGAAILAARDAYMIEHHTIGPTTPWGNAVYFYHHLSFKTSVLFALCLVRYSRKVCNVHMHDGSL